MVLGRVLAALGVGALTAGCLATVDGVPRRAGAAQHAEVQSAASLLPTDDEVRDAVGNELPAHTPPVLGGIEALPDGLRDDANATPIGCVGVVVVAPRIVYEKGPVTAAALQTYWNYASGVTVSSAHAAAVKLSSGPEAKRLFTAFVQQWLRCTDATVTVHTRDTELYSKVTDVHIDATRLSVTITSWDNHHTPPFPVEHAIGVESEYIADVDVAVSPHPQSGVLEGHRATAIVELMLRKVPGPN